MDFGETFRIIRKQKKISLQKIAEKDISYSALASFERGESMISFELLIILLKKLQLSLDEFYCLCKNSRETEFDIFSKKAAYCLHTGDSEGLEKLAQEEDEKFMISKLKFHKCNAIICKSLQNNLSENASFVSPEEEIFMNDYLWSVEIWTKYELSLLNYSLPIIPLASLSMFIKEIWESLPDDFLTDKLHSYKFNLINSAISMMIDHENFSESQKWIKKMKTRLADSQDFFQMTYLYMLELLIEKKLSPSQAVEKKYQELQSTLKHMGVENFAKNFEIEWHNL